MRNAPDYIQFYPTLRCNQSCDFCFNRSLQAVPDMSLRGFTHMLHTLAEHSVKTLDIMGGEPTLHADIMRLVSEAVQRGLRVNISSNGTNTGCLAELMAAGRQVNVGISINDRETFGKLKEFIKLRRPIVKMIYTKTMDPVLADDILQLHPKKFYFIYRDVLTRDELPLSVPFYQFLNPVHQRKYALKKIGTVSCSGFLPDTDQYPGLASVRCPAGTTKLGVMPDGSVYPCNLFFGKKEFLLGNILRDGFETIWNHPRLMFFRTFSGNRCPRKTCGFHAQCHGGCPAHALALSGDPGGPDLRCLSS
jgi:radical SAM protein with 4Fe4S-binding SPASM domain